MSRRRAPRNVREAVRRELRAIGATAPDLAHSSDAAAAKALAAELDRPGTSTTAKATASKALNDAMERIKARARRGGGGDGIDDLAEQRSRRRAQSRARAPNT